MGDSMSVGAHAELNFIEGLGRYGEPGKNLTKTEKQARRIRLLQGYIDSLPFRHNWFPGANVMVFRHMAETLLERELRSRSA